MTPQAVNLFDGMTDAGVINVERAVTTRDRIVGITDTDGQLLDAGHVHAGRVERTQWDAPRLPPEGPTA